MTVIEVKNVWKKFRLYHEKRPSLKEIILFKGRGKWEDFWVLKDINLKIEKGTTVGLIGQNGSGKSTLLKLLTNIIYPDKGQLNIKGRVSSLLELGAGFHPDFTGRENIYYNSSVFGLTKKEIDKRVDEIIEFSELEEFIDNPVRSYSSGMYMRLAFATAINVDPDILLIDEVLAVGDANFQKKCLRKINEFRKQGKTIVFVSHDHNVVAKLCNYAVWLDQGEIKASGGSKGVIDSYLAHMAEQEEIRLAGEHKQREENDVIGEVVDNERVARTKEEVNSEQESQGQSPNRWGTREIEITDVKLLDGKSIERHVFDSGEHVTIQIRYKVNKGFGNPVFGIGIFRDDGICCYGTNTEIDNLLIKDLKDQGAVLFKVDLNLTEGHFLLNVAVHDEDGYMYDYQSSRYSFVVNSKLSEVGICKLPHQWIIS
ncbi:MAG: ABC transporter ATP-binding protein [Clostridia bacterium]|nr:ABC transporter ATP-binding protein [Clostridia bacterium]